MQVIFDILLRNLIILFLGVCMSACSIISAPVMIPLSLAMEMTGRKPYYNPKYIVTKECTRNIAQVLAVETGIVFDDYNLTLMQGIITRLLHTKSDQTSSFIGFVRFSVDDSNYYVVIENKEKIFRYYISYNSRNLVLVLAHYQSKRKKSSYNYVNTFRGHESIVLVECKL